MLAEVIQNIGEYFWIVAGCKSNIYIDHDYRELSFRHYPVVHSRIGLGSNKSKVKKIFDKFDFPVVRGFFEALDRSIPEMIEMGQPCVKREIKKMLSFSDWEREPCDEYQYFRRGNWISGSSAIVPLPLLLLWLLSKMSSNCPAVNCISRRRDKSITFHRWKLYSTMH